jgi:hypothetical protein
MIYLTGKHALNLPCSLLTCGDWHTSALRWDRDKLNLRNSEESAFKDYGIEFNKTIPEHDEKYNVANHIRASLDLLEIGFFTVAQGMNKDFICNDDYNDEIFNQVSRLRKLKHWESIDRFMDKEYLSKWFRYKEKNI